MSVARSISDKMWRDSTTKSFDADRAMMNIEDLRKVVYELWEGRARSARFKFLVTLAFVTLNIYSVISTVLQECDEDQYSEAFCTAADVYQFMEVIVVVGHALRVLADCLLFLSKNSQMNQGVHVGVLAHNLEVASSFSCLAFLPVPPKVSYWVAKRRYFLSVLILDPPVLNGRLSVLRPSTWDLQEYGCCGKIAAGLCYVLVLGTVQIIIPMGYCILPFLAPVAFLVKMASLPKVSVFHTWTRAEWATFAAVLNHTGKIWDVEMVEQRSILKLFRRNVEHLDKVVPGQVLQEIGQAAVDTIGWVDAAMLMSSIDSEALGDILSKFIFVNKRAAGLLVDDPTAEGAKAKGVETP
eukprot:TRINITY_DN6203_c0_g1_i1.p1 TRINITY_DN6203_c0_g1~~TRINITY_DN6203_c0_g1_i1.p1  ORF type:complete len:354 (+),score=28.23 TRINITY_DN6203_c0_g1_i1:111-1172(+)